MKVTCFCVCARNKHSELNNQQQRETLDSFCRYVSALGARRAARVSGGAFVEWAPHTHPHAHSPTHSHWHIGRRLPSCNKKRYGARRDRIVREGEGEGEGSRVPSRTGTSQNHLQNLLQSHSFSTASRTAQNWCIVGLPP